MQDYVTTIQNQQSTAKTTKIITELVKEITGFHSSMNIKADETKQLIDTVTEDLKHIFKMMRIIYNYKKLKRQIDIISILIDLFIKTGEETNFNYSPKLDILKSIIGNMMKKKHGVEYGREVSNAILSKIYRFDDDGIGKNPGIFDCLCC